MCGVKGLEGCALRVGLLSAHDWNFRALMPRFPRQLHSFKHESVATVLLSQLVFRFQIAAAVTLKTMLILDNLTIDDELELDTSHGSATDGEYVTDFDPDQWMKGQPEAEAMREACASGNLTAVQSVFKIHWLDRPIDERIDRDELGANGLCEAIRRNDATIAHYLLSNVISMQPVHFALAAEYHAYSILQLYIDRKWDINTYLSRMQPPALS